LLDATDQGAGAVFNEPGFHLGVLSPIQREHLRHRSLEELWCRTDAEDAALAAAERRSALSKRLRLRKKAARPGEHLSAVGGEDNPPSDAIE
jgi:hypothetical protein